MKAAKLVVAAIVGISCFFGIAPFASAIALSDGYQDASNSAQKDAQIKADVVNKALNKSQFKNVQASVENGIVTLRGTTDLYEYKADADKRAHRIKNVVAVQNLIEVAGGDVSDEQLQQRLVEKLQYDRVGYGNTFNAISVSVQNGAVTLGGRARTPVDKDSAISLVSNYPGVKDVVDDIDVDPVSPNDDRIRMQVARAIYGFPSLNRYALDPAKPIRISVQNGNVELNGVVDRQADKDAANIRANSVAGVFSVTNNLVVATQMSEKKSK